MRTTTAVTAILVLSWAVSAPSACAQRGMGEPAGVGQQTAKPKVVSLSGTVLVVETGPCKKTTGRANVGAHFLLKTPNGETLNIHLGPADAVDHIAKQLTVGKKVTVRGFRTTRMPENHYVAQSVALGTNTFRLRDEGLRPFWARGNGVSRGLRGPNRGYGRGVAGSGYGPDPAWGGARGYGRGPWWAGGRGYGYGRRWASGRWLGFGPQ